MFGRHRRFNSQPPEGGWPDTLQREILRERVSTHSRPKAAGSVVSLSKLFASRFNSQPPEGGWASLEMIKGFLSFGFNSQPPEGGWPLNTTTALGNGAVSTHSRPKAAGTLQDAMFGGGGVSTHSRPKAAGQYAEYLLSNQQVSTHSRPKAAGG